MSRFLFIGAHPDDPDLLFGGTAIKLIRQGHQVKFVAAVNGDAGHQSMTREALARRRHAEAQKSAAMIGLTEYHILPHHDCYLDCNSANREEMVREIRKFQPDVVITHWAGDYHADHRACGQLVLDSFFLLGVPLYCPDTPICEKTPVLAYCYHRFTQPRPLRVDATVEIDSVLEEKYRVLDCHESQMYEWLPWVNQGHRNLDVSNFTWEQKKNELYFCMKRFEQAANLGRQELIRRYGKRGETIRFAEVFEQSEYGLQLSPEQFAEIFPK